MDVRLPPELQRAVEALARQFPTKDSSARAAALSATYRSGGSSVAAVQSDADVAAYATARMPATYAAITAALTATHDRVPDFAPHSLLDAGAGPGTASWTAASFWPGLRSITMVDSHARFRAVAAQFTQSSSSSALQASDIVTGDLLTWSAQGRFDLVIAAYALAEIAQTDLPRA